MQTCATLICSSTSPASAANVNGAAKAAAAAAAAAASGSSAGGRATPVSSSVVPSGSSTPILPGNTVAPTPTSGHDDQDQSVICVNYVLR